jgi:diaminopimelate decarboxylase
MDHFAYVDGRLAAEEVPLARIAEAVGTPFYCYSTATLEHHYRVFADALDGLDATICYAVKANGNTAVIRTLARLGAGADVVSGGELVRALAAGVPAAAIVYSGVGKTRDEMAAALSAGVLQINVESEPEIDVLQEVAASKGVIASVAVRINPDVDARTHEKITTGLSENKFGIEWTRTGEIYAKAAAMPNISMTGIAVHIGSQLSDLGPYAAAYGRLRGLVTDLRANGHTIDRLDLGGGLGIPYGDTPTPMPSPANYGAVVRDAVGDLDCRLVFEPGRVIVGNAGILVTRVIYVKKGATRTFVIVDAAMNDLIRPSLYGAYHAIVPVAQADAAAPLAPVDVVGPICETGDTLASQRDMPPLAADDLLVIRSAGAYSAVMASSYNSRDLAPEVLVRGEDFAVVGERLDIDAMLARERYPNWLSDEAEGA